MIKTSQVVEKLFYESDTAQLAAAEGLLNLSAFARQIQDNVSELAMKDVAVGTITTALHRLLEEQPVSAFKPTVVLSELAIHPRVIDFTYEKHSELLKTLPTLMHQLELNRHFFTLTQGPEEITIIADSHLTEILLRELGTPHASYEELSAVSVRFSQEYLAIPNTIYTIMASLAVKRVNVMEMVSTLTSLTFVVHNHQLNLTLEALKTLVV